MTDLVNKATEAIDKLFLELSQFTKARTKNDLMLEQLLYAVERKFPDESRFETALRYIQQAERSANSGTTADATHNVKFSERSAAGAESAGT